MGVPTPPPPPILDLLMAKLGLNLREANGDNKVLSLSQSWGMGCFSWGIINPLSLWVQMPTCRASWDGCGSGWWLPNCFLHGGNEVNLGGFLVCWGSQYLRGPVVLCLLKKMRLFTRGCASPPSPSTHRPAFLWRGSRHGPPPPVDLLFEYSSSSK